MAVTTGYFEAAGLRPVAGRLPTWAELRTGAPLIVVSERVARQYWPNAAAIGQSLTVKGRAFTVVGVVGDARYLALDQEEPWGVIYWPIVAKRQSSLSNVLVTFQPGRRFSLDDIINYVSQQCPACRWTRDDVWGQSEMMSSALGWTIRKRRLNAWLFSAFGLAALVIVGTGILGVVAMSASRRTREIGVRMALGATPACIVRQVLREQIATVLAGILCGGLVTTWAVRFLRSYLYKLDVYDLPTWMVAVGLLLLVALIGSLVPSLRASRVDPVRALRAD